MHKSRLGFLVIDCEGGDIDAHAAFWAEALGRTVEEKPRDPRYRRLESEKPGIGILVQSVDHAPRVHLDIETDDVGREVARLEKLGAGIVREMENWTVMEAASGHRFCVVKKQLPGFDETATRWPD
ncbi:VOC family protein [Roseibium aggregatum]|uniref:VOC family protein n=1 Tax=Roseibium aggregatum TaxID=187304 RepID=A0A939EHJ3_9HYPH|nr:VOC family protein [Roseibium aggregatum]MBN9672831.1 VOC family protein [Roseibium aggregatum]